tara:strand:- start:710 stop:997 length:288 start_codon:yes stop_codon:yes gene_type:complete
MVAGEARAVGEATAVGDLDLLRLDDLLAEALRLDLFSALSLAIFLPQALASAEPFFILPPILFGEVLLEGDLLLGDFLLGDLLLLGLAKLTGESS